MKGLFWVNLQDKNNSSSEYSRIKHCQNDMYLCAKCSLAHIDTCQEGVDLSMWWNQQEDSSHGQLW